MLPGHVEVDHRTCGAFVHDLLACTFAGWVNIITVFFDGEPYSYTFPLANSDATPREARYEAKDQGNVGQALHNFLHEIEHLDMGAAH